MTGLFFRRLALGVVFAAGIASIMSTSPPPPPFHFRDVSINPAWRCPGADVEIGWTLSRPAPVAIAVGGAEQVITTANRTTLPAELLEHNACETLRARVRPYRHRPGKSARRSAHPSCFAPSRAIQIASTHRWRREVNGVFVPWERSAGCPLPGWSPIIPSGLQRYAGNRINPHNHAELTARPLPPRLRSVLIDFAQGRPSSGISGVFITGKIRYSEESRSRRARCGWKGTRWQREPRR
jgi:hypothetical protein